MFQKEHCCFQKNIAVSKRTLLLRKVVCCRFLCEFQTGCFKNAQRKRGTDMNICQKHLRIKEKNKDCPAKGELLNPALPSSFFCWMLCQLTSHPPAPIAGISKRYRRLPMPFHRTRVVSVSLRCQYRFQC